MNKPITIGNPNANPATCGACQWYMPHANMNIENGECGALPPVVPVLRKFAAINIGPTVLRDRPACSLFKTKIGGAR
jgi:hypothetical protein